MKTKTIQVLHGPNLNLLGEREPDLYGRTTLAEIDRALVARGRERGYRVACLQSNDEGRLVTALQDARRTAAGVLLNPAGYTHTSVALLDALRALAVPKVEVHLTNLFAREPERRRSVTAAAVDGVVSGFGADSYHVGLDALIDLIERRSRT
jgi:3-dehydroquinate dehydratase II